MHILLATFRSNGSVNQMVYINTYSTFLHVVHKVCHENPRTNKMHSVPQKCLTLIEDKWNAVVDMSLTYVRYVYKNTARKIYLH